MTIEERVAAINVKVEAQQKAIDDHEDRLREHEDRLQEQEKMAVIVDGLVETTTNLKETSATLVEAVNEIRIEKAKTESLINIIKNIKPKDVIYMLVALILILSMITGSKVDTSTIKQLEQISAKLEHTEVIADEVIE